MASFSDLPNEMIREVARHVMPEDMEKFSLVSKRIYAVNLPFLKEHRELKQRYSAFDNLEKAAFDGDRLQKSDRWDEPVTTNCFPGNSVSNLLIDVLDNPRVAPYIKELRLDGWFLEWEFLVPDTLNMRHEHTPYTEEQVLLFKQALSRYVLPKKLESWVEKLESGDEGPTISLLLILLPNITSIKSERCSNLVHHFQEVIEGIKTDCVPDTSILSHLERVNLQYNDNYEGANPRSLKFLALLATVPSLKSLYCQAIDIYDGFHDFSCLSPHSSNITDLSFKKCNLHLTHLGDLFQGLKALLIFHYIYDTYYEEPDPEYDIGMAPWDPAGICKLLLRHAPRSLKVLDLRSEQEPVEPIKALRDFEVLRELTLSFSLFRNGAIFPTQTLAYDLPESIQKISLHDVEIKHLSMIDDTVREVVSLKLDRLPRLEKVCFCVSFDPVANIYFTEKLRKLCEEAGFELSFTKQWDGEGEDYPVT